jgi:hypothetical protein
MTLSPAIWIPSAVVLLVAIISYLGTHRSAVWKEGESLRVAYREETLSARKDMTTLVEKLDATNKTLDTTNATLAQTLIELAETRAVNVNLAEELRIARGEK